jgi:uncharacterized protein YdcH (DUF465 family)
MNWIRPSAARPSTAVGNYDHRALPRPLRAAADHHPARLADQIDQLRDSLEAVADRVRRHEEEIRKLKKTD